MPHSELRPPPARLRLPRVFASAVPLSLALLTMAVCSEPIHAGTWQFSCTGNGSGNAVDPYYGPWGGANWTPPATVTGSSYSIPSYGFPIASPGSLGPGVTASRSFTITATITGTWIPDSTLPSDPAPTSIWLIEKSESDWAARYTDSTGTHPGTNTAADDGLSDPPVVSTVAGVNVSAVVSSANAPLQTAPPAHWFTKSVSGGTFTLTHTFSGSATVTTSSNRSAGSYTIGAIFTGYTLSIHAQPYNFQQTSVTDNGDGSLTFTYGWSSTDGNLGSLGSCYFHERVTYPGGNPYIIPAPFSYARSLPNPTVAPGTGTSGLVMTTTSNNSDIQHTWTPVAPYTNATITAQQQYEYDDVATGVSNTIIPGPGSGPFSITRTIAPRPPYAVYWWYSCTKQGTTAWLPLQ